MRILKDFIINNGCFSKEENTRIFNKWFSNGPRYYFKVAAKKLNFKDKCVCDLGCAYGTNLVNLKNNSYGIEINKDMFSFVKSIGLEVYNIDFISGDISKLKKPDVIWASAILEHIDSPHIFLRRCFNLLKDDGLICIYVPIIPFFTFLEKIPLISKFFISYTHGDHINAFTQKTLKFFCKRAGFEIIDIGPFYPYIGSLLNLFNITGMCFCICKKINNWEYPLNSTRRKSLNVNGYEYI